MIAGDSQISLCPLGDVQAKNIIAGSHEGICQHVTALLTCCSYWSTPSLCPRTCTMAKDLTKGAELHLDISEETIIASNQPYLTSQSSEYSREAHRKRTSIYTKEAMISSFPLSFAGDRTRFFK
jgi:hypothetical protein